ncbi:VOC family protein [Sphingosinicella sp. CPCC 101087]|uniref:VOC family protein n=1 Tax=Sphingosinicella sp. CPCC 101087 TaxID=2497754 RepID=UPI00101C23DE|nr:VOC family protein [Sphingosinicella sp. CPCC 101087]
MSVVGMGGYFFRAKDPEAIKAWYREHLGVGGGCGTGASGEWFWYPEPGPLLFEPFREASDYFPLEKQVMINLRVRDLDGLLARLKASGIDAVTKAEWDTPETGRFARIHDPEGNPIELWEPPAQ